MEPWAIVITALGGLSGLAGFVTAVATAIQSAKNARQSARQSEVDSLRKTVESLQSENVRLRDRVFDLEQENDNLRRALGLRSKAEKGNTQGLARR
jgi:gas vesicle protein